MEHTRIAIVGSGFSGLGMAIRLKREGIDDFVVLERATDIGGTWRDNTYPGCACDVPAHVYSYSFAPNPEWSSMLAPQREIHAYLHRCAEENGVLPHVRFDCALRGADWDEHERLWRLDTSAGPRTADAIVQATGPMSAPIVPELPGRESFAGASFHSARWDHDVDLTGKRVAVIGTGASGIQFVPEIQPQVERLLVFQRTPPWVVPRFQRRYSALARRLWRRLPPVQQALRQGMFAVGESFVLAMRRPPLIGILERLLWSYWKRQIPDPALQEKLRPRYRFGCKRVLISNDWYRAVCEPNVDVVTDGIRELRERSIVTADGAEHEVDVIVWATGFDMTDPPISHLVRGRGGQSMGDLWRVRSPQALRGTTVHGFPNYFILVGPNTGTGNNSLIVNVESQIAYVLECLKAIDGHEVAAVEPRAEAEDAWTKRLQERFENTVWAAGCTSHYLDRHGRNVSVWPDRMHRFRVETRRFDPAEYVLYSANGNGRAPSPAPASDAALAR